MGQNQSKLWPTFVRPVFIITESDKPELEFDSESEFESDSDAASFHYPSTHAALMPVPRKIPAKLPDGFLSLTSIRGLVVRSGAAQPWAYGTNYPTSWSDELRELWDGKRLLVKHDGYYDKWRHNYTMKAMEVTTVSKVETAVAVKSEAEALKKAYREGKYVK